MIYCIQSKYVGFGSHNQTKNRPNISAEEIAEIVSKSLNIRLSDMRSRTRKRPIVEARHIAMYLIRKHTDITLKETGGLFGGRNHATALHACDTVQDLIDTNKFFKNLIISLNKRIYEN